MIRLHTFAPAWGLPTFTPFGLKLMAHMKLTGIPYELVVEGNPARGPRGKVPWIEDGTDVIADSAFIVDHLTARYGDALDAWLAAEQRSIAHALRRMVEEGLCFAILHTRWVDDATYRQAMALALVGVPPVLRSAIAPLVRRRILRDLCGQGIGRFDANEAAHLGCRDLDVIASRITSMPFAMGERVCSLDAVFYAFLAVIIAVPLDTPLQRHARQLPGLSSYMQRVQALLGW